MSRRQSISVVLLVVLPFLSATLAYPADPADKPPSKPRKQEERSALSEMRHQANRLGDEIGKNIGQAFRNANEGFKKRFNTNRSDGQ